MGVRSWVAENVLRQQPLQEGSLPAGQIDTDEHLYRLLGGSQRSLNPYLQERALRLAWSLFERNPLAHGVIEVMKDHVVGDGFRVESDNDDVMKVLDRHWDDAINHWDLKQHDRVRELSLFGEQMYPVFVNEANGHVKLASIDPLNIREVWVNPENTEDVLAIVVNAKLGVGQAGSGSLGWQGDRVYRVIHEDEDPLSETFGKLIGTVKDETYTRPHGKVVRPYDGSCFWFTVNKVTGTRRGRSDILSSMDWMDMLDQILFNFSDRTLLMNNFIWDVTLTGATQGQIDAWQRDNLEPPRPASLRVHNEKEEWKAQSPSFHSEEYESLHRTIKAMTLSGPGLPPHWFGEQDSNRATALEMGSPTLKRLAARQLYIRWMITHICRFQIDQAIIAGELPEPAEDEPYEFTVVVPEMSVRDAVQGAEALSFVSQAIQIAWGSGWIDDTEAIRLFALAAVQVGADIDIDEMMKRMEEAGITPGQKATAAAEELIRSGGLLPTGVNGGKPEED